MIMGNFIRRVSYLRKGGLTLTDAIQTAWYFTRELKRIRRKFGRVV